MTEVVEKVEGTEVVATNDGIQEAYDKIANPNKVEDKPEVKEVKPEPEVKETVKEEVKTEPVKEAPPDDPKFTKDLMTQVARIPELEKRLRDGDGRYGALKQTIEQLNQRIAESTTKKEVLEAEVDVDDLLKDVTENFGEELSAPLKAAFGKVLARKGANTDPEQIEKLVTERLSATEAAKRAEAEEQIAEFHPDYEEVVKDPKYTEWLGTLKPSTQRRIETSIDPYFAAEMLDQHKEWLQAKVKDAAPKPADKQRLEAAVLPTNGTKNPPKTEPNAIESINAGYERIAKKRM